MSSINGYANEYEFVKYLNNKKVCELNPMFRELIDTLFYNIDENSIIKCWRNHYQQKSDILIRINNVIKGISIKKGIKNSIHVERVSDFISFLKENNVDQKIIIEYLKYHYADGSITGYGKKRISISEYKLNNQKSIDEINKVFNRKNLLNKAIDRFIIKGNNSNYHINAIIYGEVDDFFWLTKDDIVDIILSKQNQYSTAVHFGPITCQPKSRCLNNNSKYEKDRFCVQLKWYNLFDNIIEHMNNKIIKQITYEKTIDKLLDN